MRVPRYVEERIRKAIPKGCWVVGGSTPVVAFGDATKARVATLGLNPSNLEFRSKRRREWGKKKRRFETCGSLGVGSFRSASTDKIRRVLAACNDYFNRNPYREWFDQLDLINRACGASYYKGTACHLDLVQWATREKWGDLPRQVRERLLKDDADFLRRQLKNENIRLLLLNGSGVIWPLQKVLGVSFREMRSSITVGNATTWFYTGQVERVRVVGWSTNLQSSFGVSNELRHRIADRVAKLS